MLEYLGKWGEGGGSLKFSNGIKNTEGYITLNE